MKMTTLNGTRMGAMPVMDAVREAIVNDITRPLGTASPGSSPGATTYRGGHPFQARVDTIRFMKERVEGNRAMAAVEFEDTEAEPWYCVIGALQQPDGSWKVDGGTSGRGGPEPEPRGPWANFGGWGWPQFLCLGGRVHGEGVSKVRLIDAAGRTVEDTVDDGIALLLGKAPVEMPCRIELLDARGALLATQSWPPERGARPRRH